MTATADIVENLCRSVAWHLLPTGGATDGAAVTHTWMDRVENLLGRLGSHLFGSETLQRSLPPYLSWPLTVCERGAFRAVVVFSKRRSYSR